MKFHAFFIDRHCSDAYELLPPRVVGLQFKLLLRSARKENDGIWAGASAWDERAALTLTGLTLDELDELIQAGLAHWARPESPDEPVDPRQLELGSVADRSATDPDRSPHRSATDPDRSPHRSATDPDRFSDRSKPIHHRSALALVVHDYDREGQAAAQAESENAKKAAETRWNRAPKQAALPFPGGANAPRPQVSDPSPIQIGRATDPTDPDRSDGGRICTAQHSTEQGSPPKPPSGGPDVAGPDLQAWREFWAWLGKSLPERFPRGRWYHASLTQLRAVRRTLSRLASDGVVVELPDAIGRIRQDLDARFHDYKWRDSILNAGDRGPTLHTYLTGADWLEPRAPRKAVELRSVPATQTAAPAPKVEPWPEDAPSGRLRPGPIIVRGTEGPN